MDLSLAHFSYCNHTHPTLPGPNPRAVRPPAPPMGQQGVLTPPLPEGSMPGHPPAPLSSVWAWGVFSSGGVVVTFRTITSSLATGRRRGVVAMSLVLTFPNPLRLLTSNLTRQGCGPEGGSRSGIHSDRPWVPPAPAALINHMPGTPSRSCQGWGFTGPVLDTQLPQPHIIGTHNPITTQILREPIICQAHRSPSPHTH